MKTWSWTPKNTPCHSIIGQVTWNKLYWNQLVTVAEWLACLTDMWEVSWSNPASYLCWNMHVGKQLAAMLAIKRLAGVTPDVNLKEYLSCTPLPSVNKAIHSSFETQGRHHQESKTGVSVAPQKGIMSSKIFLKTILELMAIICLNLNISWYIDIKVEIESATFV